MQAQLSSPIRKHAAVLRGACLHPRGRALPARDPPCASNPELDDEDAGSSLAIAASNMGERAGLYWRPTSRPSAEARRGVSPPAPAAGVRGAPAAPGVVALRVRVHGGEEHVGVVPEDARRAVPKLIHAEDRDVAEWRATRRRADHHHPDHPTRSKHAPKMAALRALTRRRSPAGVVARARDQGVGRPRRGDEGGGGASSRAAAEDEAQVALELDADAVDDGEVGDERREQRLEHGGLVVGVVEARLRVHARAGLAGGATVARAEVGRGRARGRKTTRRRGRRGRGASGGGESAPRRGREARPPIPRGLEVPDEAGLVRARGRGRGTSGTTVAPASVTTPADSSGVSVHSARPRRTSRARARRARAGWRRGGGAPSTRPRPARIAALRA